MNIKEISAQEASQLCQSSTAILVDVREQDELDELAYDVACQKHIPLSQFADRYEELPKNQELVIACKSGGRSLKAAAFLKSQGYDQVYNLQGGIIAWLEQNYATIGNAENFAAKYLAPTRKV